MFFTAPVQIKFLNVFFHGAYWEKWKWGRNPKPWSNNDFIQFAQREREKTMGLGEALEEAEILCVGQWQMV